MIPFTVEMSGLKFVFRFFTLLCLSAAPGVLLFDPRPDRLTTAAVMVVFSIPLALGWIYFSMRLTVDDESISLARLGRRPVAMAWREMHKAEFRSFARCLIVSSDDGRRIRIEEQIDRFREIYDLVAARAPGLVPKATDLPWPVQYSTGGMSRFQCGLLAFFSLLCFAGFGAGVFGRDAATALLGGIFSGFFGFAALRIPLRYELGSEAVVVSFLVGRAAHPVSSLVAIEGRVHMHNGVPFDLLVLRFGRKRVALAGMFTEVPLHVLEARLRLEYATQLASPAALHPE